MPSRARERLQQNRHQVGEHDDAEQRVAEARAAGEVGRPVARVHVADRDQVARAGEREELAPEAGAGIGMEPWTSGRLTDPGGTRQPAWSGDAGDPSSGVCARASGVVRQSRHFMPGPSPDRDTPASSVVPAGFRRGIGERLARAS